MRDIFKLSIILLIITMVSAGVLGTVNDVTKVVIQEKAMEASIVFMKEIIADADDFKAVENPAITGIDSVEEAYEALKGGSTIGYVVKSVTSGYGGDVTILTGISTEGTLMGIRVASQSETPGLGSKIADAEFRTQFEGKTATELSLDSDIDALSGATVSSKAAIKGVNASIKAYNDVLK